MSPIKIFKFTIASCVEAMITRILTVHLECKELDIPNYKSNFAQALILVYI